jgi:hypothetical protein
MNPFSNDTLILVFSYLDVHDILSSIELVNKTWNITSRSNVIWKSICEYWFPHVVLVSPKHVNYRSHFINRIKNACYVCGHDVGDEYVEFTSQNLVLLFCNTCNEKELHISDFNGDGKHFNFGFGWKENNNNIINNTNNTDNTSNTAQDKPFGIHSNPLSVNDSSSDSEEENSVDDDKELDEWFFLTMTVEKQQVTNYYCLDHEDVDRLPVNHDIGKNPLYLHKNVQHAAIIKHGGIVGLQREKQRRKHIQYENEQTEYRRKALQEALQEQKLQEYIAHPACQAYINKGDKDMDFVLNIIREQCFFDNIFTPQETRQILLKKWIKPHKDTHILMLLQKVPFCMHKEIIFLYSQLKKKDDPIESSKHTTQDKKRKRQEDTPMPANKKVKMG